MALKNIIIMIILILLATGVTGLDECKKVTSVSDIPCQITSTWNYTPTCGANVARVYDENADNIQNYTFSDYGATNRCYTTFNITTLGSYNYILDNGDTGNILIEGDKNMAIGLILAVIAIGFAFLIMSFKIEKEYADIRLVAFFSSIVFFVAGLGFGFPMLSSLPNESSFKTLLITTVGVFLAICMVIIYLFMARRFEKTFERIDLSDNGSGIRRD